MSAAQQTRFRKVWRVLAELGACDSVDSAEYRRLLTLWLSTECVPPIGRFIIAEANRPPGGEVYMPMPPGTLYRVCPHCGAFVRAPWIGGVQFFEDHLRWNGSEGNICQWSGVCVDTLYVEGTDPPPPPAKTVF